jgi:spore coat protein A
MKTRREFIRCSAAGVGASMFPAALLSTSAQAQTAGNMSPSAWAGATDPTLLQNVWNIRFSNTLPWALDPTNAVLAKALNVDAAGNVPVLNVTLKPGLPQLGFILKPDTGATNVFSVKAGQTPWPMLGPLGGTFKDGTTPIPVTTLWGYGNHDLEAIFTNGGGLGVTFPARSFVVQRGSPVTVHWYNNLVDASGPLPHLVGVDQTISMQTVDDTKPGSAKINGVPIAVHHHGGNSAAEFDGGPDQWFTPQRKQIGPGISSANMGGSDHLTYTYNNDDEASMHWYHDHGEGVTRINAYAGLAGLYVIRDANEAKLIKDLLLPTGEQELPIVIQDKVFQADGNLAYTGDSPVFNGWAVGTANVNVVSQLPGTWALVPPTATYDPNDPATIVTGDRPTHVPEMFGDVICVNGMAWPSAKVERRQYRLRLLNGSDSRVYTLSFGNLTFMQIGTDLGLLNVPVPMNTITIFPGERKDIVIDFSQVPANTKLVVTNSAPFPYPNGPGTSTYPGDPWATIMQFDVSKPLNQTVNKKTQLKLGADLRGNALGTPRLPLLLAAPRNAAAVRKIMLGEGCDEYGRIMPLLGTVADGTKTFHDAPDISPALGTTEVWEFWNTTVDSHPIHMHLVRFRIADRQKFTGAVQAKVMSNGWTGVQFTTPPALSGRAAPAPLSEQGWKDTVVCPPGYVTRVVAQFNRPGKFVYHCHILGHEEHDMMRWFEVK